MSGSSQVDFKSEYYHLRSESACMNFSVEHNPPGTEQRWHEKWMKKGARWLERVKPILDQRFAMLAASPDPDWPLVPIEDRFPLWNDYRAPDLPPPWKVDFLGMSGPGTSTVTVAFSRMPSEAARERFKRELIKDLAMVDENEKGTLR